MHTRRALALAAALALAGTLVFPSTAAPLLDGAGDTVDARGDVELLPATDSEYATIGPDGELALDLTPGEVGLNPDSVTSFGEVFYVRYTGDRYAEVWVTADSPAVSFAVDAQQADSRAQRVRVGPGDVLPVSIRVDTTEGDVEGVGGFTVHTRVADPEQGTTAASTDSTEAVTVPAVQRRVTGPDAMTFTMLAPSAGESITLDTSGLAVAGTRDRATLLESVRVTPASGDALTVDVERTAAGPVPSAAADALGAVRVDASADVDAATFRLTVDDAFLADATVEDLGDLALYRQSDGEWSEVSLSVVGEREGGLVVEGTTDGFSTFVLAAERPAIGVSEASVSPAAMTVNESATVTAAVTNDGGAAGERTVAVTVDGEVVAERSVSLAAGESTTVTASVAPGLGEHAVAVDGVGAGTLVVQADDSGGSENAESDEADSESVDSPAEPLPEPAGFEAWPLAVAGLAAAVVVVSIGVWRRRRGESE